MISAKHYIRLSALGITLLGCAQASQEDPAGLQIAVGFYPLQYLAEQLAGPSAAITNMTPPGVEPHDLDLAPTDVVALTDADVVFYLRDFQPALEAVLDEAHAAVDLLPPGVTDPHMWLDPRQMGELAGRVTAWLTDVDPDGADGYAANAAALQAVLGALGREYEADLAFCEIRTLVVSHAAFGHLAAAYGFEQVAISGLDPDDEPDPAEFEAVADRGAAAGVTTVYAETLLEADLAATVAAEIGAEVAVLDPIEGLDSDALAAGADYASVMRDNLATLAAGQEC